MSAISFKCSACDAQLRIQNPALVGKKIRCPKCGEPTQVRPISNDVPEEEEAAPRPRPRREEEQAVAPRKKQPQPVSEDDDEFDEEDEELEDRPRKSKQNKDKKSRGKAATGINMPLLLGAAGGGVVIVGVVIFLLIQFVFTDNKDNPQGKNKNPAAIPPAGGFAPKPTVGPAGAGVGGGNKQPPVTATAPKVKPELIATITLPEASGVDDLIFLNEETMHWVNRKFTDTTIVRWDVKTRKELPDPITLQSGSYGRLSWDGKLFSSFYYEEKVLRLVELPSKRSKGEIKVEGTLGHGSNPILISRDSKKLVYWGPTKDSESKKYLAAVWDVEKVAKLGQKEILAAVHGLTISPDGKRVAYATGGFDNPLLHLWDIVTDQEQIVKVPVDEAAGDFGPLNEIAISGNGKTLAAIRFRKIKLFGLDSGSVVGDLTNKEKPGFTGSVIYPTISDDGKWVTAYTSTDGTDDLLLWHVPTRKQVAVFSTGSDFHPGFYRISPQGRYFVACDSLGRKIKVWDLFPDGVIPQ